MNENQQKYAKKNKSKKHSISKNLTENQQTNNPYSEDPTPQQSKLVQLRQKIATQKSKTGKTNNPKKYSGHGIGLKIVSELIVGFALGGVIGYTLDYFLKTKPVFLLIFLILGIVAGFNNIYKMMKNNNL